MSAGSFWRIAVTAGDAGVPRLVAALEPFCESVSWIEAGAGLWRIEGTARRAPDRARLTAALAEAADCIGTSPPPVAVECLPERDWLAENRRSLAPIRAGRYYVHGEHVAPPAADGRIALRIEAGLAFGSGSHESTRGCLLALDGLAKGRAYRRPLDLGTGSGILAIAMARTWRTRVLAADIDPVALGVARENARINGAGGLVRFVLSDGWNGLALRRGPGYDLVTANILAAPLRRMAPAFAAGIAAGGMLVLSGLLAAQEAGILAAYRAQGFGLDRRIVLGEWPTLVLRR